MNLLGQAHSPQQLVHVGPEPLPLLPFFIWQPGEGVLGMDAGKVEIVQPGLQPLTNAGAELAVAVVELRATPGEVLAEPFEGLPAEQGAYLRRQLACVLALAAPSQRRFASGAVAGRCQYVFS